MVQIGSINFVADKIKLAEMMIFVFNRVENIVGKGENAGFQKAFYFWLVKVGTVW